MHRFQGRGEAQAGLRSVGFYDGKRLHSTLGYRSPNDFERLPSAA